MARTLPEAISDRYDYDTARELLQGVLEDLSALAGDTMPPADVQGWHDLARSAARRMRALARQLDAARERPHPGPIVFPSPGDLESIGDEPEPEEPWRSGGKP